MRDAVIKIENLTKEYRLGVIGSGTLYQDLQSWMSRIRGSEDPNRRIGAEGADTNTTFRALNGINLQVYQGDTIGIIGGNGAGKSTLLKILSRVTAPTSGQVKFKGRIASLLEVGTGFHPELTGRENIYLNGAIMGMTKKEVEGKFDEIVAFSELEQFIDTPVKRYSSGMYVKLAFAVAAHLDPEILVVDEVLAVGDMKFQQKCLGKMGDAAGEGRTVLYVSHNMNTIQQLCSRALVLDHGIVKYDGSVDEGIQIYMDNSHSMSLFTHVEDQKRQTHFQRRATIISTLIKNKDNCIFRLNEKLQFILEWRAERKLENLFIRAEVMYADDTPAGTAFSKVAAAAVHENQKRSSLLSMDISGLAPGRYYITLAIYNLNEFGVFENVDKVTHAVSFEIENRSEIIWTHRWWGHVRLPDIEVT